LLIKLKTMDKNLTKKGTERLSNAGRKQIYIDDVGVLLSVQVPSKQKERFKETILAMRKPYEVKK
jgi:hypothetical protein